MQIIRAIGRSPYMSASVIAASLLLVLAAYLGGCATQQPWSPAPDHYQHWRLYSNQS